MTAPRPSNRACAIAPFEVMDVMTAARERDAAVASAGGRPTCHLEVGQPSSSPPQRVLDAAAEAMTRPHGYTDALGLPELRARIARFHHERDGIEVDAERVVVTAGASAGCLLALAALADVREQILVTEPGYPCYANDARVLGLDVLTAHLDDSTAYRATPEVLDAATDSHPAGSLAAVVVASPANPTGTVLDAADLAALRSWCDEHNATLVVDEIYHGTSLEPLASAAAFDDAVVIQSFSKYFCMTGWRLGWMVLPTWLVRPVEKLAQNLFLAPPTLSQHAAMAALESTEALDRLAPVYRSNAQRIETLFRSHGFTDIAPAKGAFYVWANVGSLGDSRDVCARWLNEIGVAATPGHDFDSVRGGEFVRLSVAGDPAIIDDAALRLGAWFEAEAMSTAS